MFISIITSIIISASVLGLGFYNYDFTSGFNFSNFFANEKGRVLGVSEDLTGAQKIINNAAEKAVKDIVIAAGQIKEASAPVISRAYLRRLPDNQDNQILPLSLTEENGFNFLSKSGAVIDCDKKVLIFGKNENTIMPIASITKLMTALVFLENNPGWDFIYEIKKEDRRDGGKIYLFLGEKVTVENLFYLSLVGSANTATIALIHSTGMSEEKFVDEMNKKAIELNLQSTYFSDPVGLDSNNVSTAREVAIFAQAALFNKDIRQATLTKKYEFITLGGRLKNIYTTDYLLDNFPQNGISIIGGKTGYTDLAGYCFVGQFIDKDGHEIISVILGSPENIIRFEETKNLSEWIYNNYEW